MTTFPNESVNIKSNGGDKMVKEKEIVERKKLLQQEISDLEAKKMAFVQETGLHLEHLEMQIPITTQIRKEYSPLKIYEYQCPFNYPNVKVDKINGNWAHGTELLRDEGSITITEKEPIIRVSVIGSACTPPGYIMLEIPNMGKKLQSVENLMGSHDLANPAWCRENTAFFEVDPGTKTITLRGGSRNPANNHYAFRKIRVEVEG